MKSRLPFPLLLALLALALLLGIAASLSWGQFGVLSPGKLLAILWGQAPGQAADRLWEAVIWNIRLPRVAMALLVGAALGTAGMLVQALFQNPLAEPYLLGISAGAALGAVLAYSAGWGLALLGIWLVPASAFAGSWIALFLVLQIAARARPMAPERLLLAGIAISGLLQALATLILLFRSPHEMREILFWLLGSLGHRGFDGIPLLAFCLLLGTVATAWLVRPLNLLATGELSAHALGLSVPRTRWLIATLSAFLAATATAACGIIAFVGLLVPHLGRLLAGPDHRRLFPVCLLLGPLLVLVSDLAARLLLSGQEIPLSVITGGVGCLFFLALLIPSRTRATHSPT